MDAISSGDLSASIDAAAILNDDHRLAALSIGTVRAEMDVLSDENGTPQFHAVRPISPEVPCVMKLDVLPDRCKGIRGAHPF
jgi:hypothetical protein